MKNDDVLSFEFIEKKLGERYVDRFKRLFGKATTPDELSTVCLLYLQQDKNYTYFIMFCNVWYECEPKWSVKFYSNKIIHQPVQKLIASVAGTGEKIDEVALHISLENMVTNGFTDSIFGKKLIEFCVDYIPSYKKDFEQFVNSFNSKTYLLYDDFERPNIYD